MSLVASGGPIRSVFSPAGVRLRVAAGTVGLRLAAIGHGRRLSALRRASPNAAGGVARFQSGAVGVWYRNGPFGIEQGFAVRRRPAGGAGALTLVMRVSGSLVTRPAGPRAVAFVGPGGSVALRYGDLHVVDATGRPLTASIVSSRSELRLRVVDAGARYPLRIDPFIQPGAELVGTGNSGANFGQTVALSADGTTALVGGPEDSGGVGAAWVFTRSGSTWTQQGEKLTGAGESGNGGFGDSVALSADGNTALVGGSTDDTEAGAAWVFTRSGSTWTSQGPKLTGSGEVGSGVGVNFGQSVALSADGNTALIGGPDDNTFVGAAWVFTRSGPTWTQQGEKLTGTGETTAKFGDGVALSADGDTALIGGDTDTGGGAAWAFTRSGSTWTQQGGKLTGAGASGDAQFGYPVALSADGNTALIGGVTDNTFAGAAWVFTRSASTWAQQGGKLTAGGEAGGGTFGAGLALSADGNAALIGGFHDNAGAGAVWAFARSGSTWTQQGDKLAGTGQFGTGIALSADSNVALIGAPQDSGGAGTAWVLEQTPAVSEVSPRAGPTTGRTSVTITGVNLEGATGVAFGSVPASSFTVVSPTEIIATSPPGAAGTVDVTVTTSVGTSAISSADQFTYQTPPVLTPPVNTGRPAITGTPRAGRPLLCSSGIWSGTPATYRYQWYRDGTPLAGATSATYTVQTLDEGSTLTCGVTASNAAGAGAPATSSPVAVPVPFVRRCPAATGRLRGSRLGLLRLGLTRRQTRHLYAHSSTHGFRYKDWFCLTPRAVRVGYASPRLLRSLPARRRQVFAGRVVWASTANPYYALDGVRSGTTIAVAAPRLRTGRALHIGLNYWYIGRVSATTVVLKVRRKVVEEIGILDPRLSRTRKAQFKLMRSFD
jgi:hypothetical protein